jgi:hypothetical protein
MRSFSRFRHPPNTEHPPNTAVKIFWPDCNYSPSFQLRFPFRPCRLPQSQRTPATSGHRHSVCSDLRVGLVFGSRRGRRYLCGWADAAGCPGQLAYHPHVSHHPTSCPLPPCHSLRLPDLASPMCHARLQKSEETVWLEISLAIIPAGLIRARVHPICGSAAYLKKYQMADARL